MNIQEDVVGGFCIELRQIFKHTNTGQVVLQDNISSFQNFSKSSGFPPRRTQQCGCSSSPWRPWCGRCSGPSCCQPWGRSGTPHLCWPWPDSGDNYGQQAIRLTDLTRMKPVSTLSFPLPGLALRKALLDPSWFLLQTITKPSLVCLTKMLSMVQQSTPF